MLRNPALAAMMFVLGLLGASSVCLSAEIKTELADPRPSFDAPRKIMLQLSSDDSRAMNNILFNAVNLQKFYGMDNVSIAVIAFGPGMKALYRDTSPVRERVQSLLKYDVEFVGCGNTMTATNREHDELIDGVGFVTAGIAEIVERQLSGWIYVHP